MGLPSKLPLRNFSYDEIEVGYVFSFERLIDENTVEDFAKLSGDRNPLHTDEAYAKGTKFGGRIAHGMLLGSLFSSLVGMLCPGQKCLYLSQSLNFRKPLLFNTKVIVEGMVTSKTDSVRVIHIETRIKDIKEIVYVDGEAQVQIRNV